MAKKKKTKKRSIGRAPKPSVQASSQPSQPPSTPVAKEAPTPVTAPVAAIDPRTAYVGADVRRIGIISVIAVLAELALWYAFESTQLGPSIYQLFIP